MISMTGAGRRLLAALAFVAVPLGAIAGGATLSFTAHSLNLNPGDRVRLLALDQQGDAYVCGEVTDSSGSSWVQVTKTDPLGQVVASYRFGNRESPQAIQVDQQGSLIVAGTGYAADFPTAISYGPATAYPVAFVVKLGPGLTGITAAAVVAGNRALTGVAPDTGASSVNVDASGNIYLGGGTTAVDFPVTAGAYETALSAGIGAFLVEFSSGLDKIVFATYYDDYQGVDFADVAVDAAGAIVCAGVYGPYAVSGTTTPESATATAIVKFAPGGRRVLWTAALAPPGAGSENVEGMALDGSGDVVVVGGSQGASSAPVGALQSCPNGTAYSGFVANLSGSNGAIQFSTDFGCTASAAPPSMAPSVNSVAVDAAGTIWITGVADLSALPVTQNSSGTGSAYVAAMAADGSSVQQLYLAPAGLFGPLALTSAGDPVALGSAGFLMLSNAAGGPSLLGVVANSAGSAPSGVIVPAELVSFYGSDLGPATPLDAEVVGGVVQSTLGGYQLLFGGVAAPLLYIGGNQINVVVPIEVYGQDSVSVTLVTPTGTFPLADLYIRPSEPEIFHDPVSRYAVAINQDGTVNTVANPARAGQIVSVWGTGSGLPGNLPSIDGMIAPTQLGLLHYPALPVSMIAGNDSLEVVYAGDSPDEVFGLLQVNFRLPQSFAVGASSLAVRPQVGAAIGAPVSIYVAP